MVTAAVCAMEREASFGEADAGAGEHHPFAQEHRMNAKQLAWRGSEKNECREWQRKRLAGVSGPIAACGRVRQWAPYRSGSWRKLFKRVNHS
jgi:hypothetical protein